MPRRRTARFLACCLRRAKASSGKRPRDVGAIRAATWSLSPRDASSPSFSGRAAACRSDLRHPQSQRCAGMRDRTQLSWRAWRDRPHSNRSTTTTASPTTTDESRMNSACTLPQVSTYPGVPATLCRDLLRQS